MEFIDLHIHSTYSDGTYTPAALAQLAKERGLRAFALTDHDLIMGNGEAASEAKRLGLEFMPGMELMVVYRDRCLHVVCLGFDTKHPAFRKLYRDIRWRKETRQEDVISCIQKLGGDISWTQVHEAAAGRPVDAYAIMRYLAVRYPEVRIHDLWQRYIYPALQKVGISREVAAKTALPAICEAGGVTSLAHFHKRLGLKGMTWEEQESALQELQGMGLDGMERYYPSYSEEEADFAARMIEKYHLLPTGGSDFHGENRPGIDLGTGDKGNLHVPYDFFAEIQKKCHERQRKV